MSQNPPIQTILLTELQAACTSTLEGPSVRGEITSACSALSFTPTFARGAEYVIDAATLRAMQEQKNLLLVDVRTPEQCPDGHIPGAVQLDRTELSLRHNQTEALLPDTESLSRTFSKIGLRPDHFVVAYDDDTGVDAARLLWTLEVIGHRNYALLNGGFAAWDDLEYAVDEHPAQPIQSRFTVADFGSAVVDFKYVLEAIDRADICIVDNRTAAEFSGKDKRANRGGHIPGAVQFDWSSTIDLHSGGTLLEPDAIREKLHTSGITPEKEIVLYCQSNRRSSHTFLILKWLGYERVKSYAGSWSEWGNSIDAPIETDPGE